MQLSSSIEVVKGIGLKTIPKLNKLNIFTVGDLCFDLPRGFMDIHEPVNSLDNNIGKLVAIKGYIVPGSVKVIKKSRLITVASLKAENIDSRITVMYFNAPYIAKQLDSRVKIYLGVLSSRNGFILSQPRTYTIEEYDAMLASPVPVYSLTKGISNNQLAKFIDNAIEIATLPEDYLTPSELDSLNLCDFATAIRTIHRPQSIEDYNRARDRIVFHEFLNYFLEISIAAKGKAREFTKSMIEVADTARLIEALPYRLTNAQLRCFEEIKADMTSGICMNRMLQGDVGSGKTIVAFLSLIMNAANNHQGALMAPTEVLANQHYEFALELVNKYKVNIRPILLTGSLKASDKKSIREAIKNGEYNVIIGTHALINDVEYKDLTLAITDEQHRFGVKQREALANFDNTHILVMSATPIPRSMSMTMFKGVKLSVLDELPADRKPIKNCVVGIDKRNTSYKFIEKEVKAGHQAYVICPMIDENEGVDLCNVIDYTATLREALPTLRIDYLHGRMKNSEKNEIMNQFSLGNIDVLVSTTVIEVGVNVPNATVMMVENADRFGLSTLHQIRGRIGRGDAQGYCIFINTSDSEVSAKRLEIVNNSNDGFHIAECDLNMRGPGEVQGIRQSGDFGFRVASIYDDAALLKKAGDYVDSLIDSPDEDKVNTIAGAVYSFGFNPVDFTTI